MGPRCSGVSAPGKACIRWGTRTKARQRYYGEKVLEIHMKKGHKYPFRNPKPSLRLQSE